MLSQGRVAVFTTAFGLAVAFAGQTSEPRESVLQEISGGIQLSVEGPRPVAAAVDALVERYGYKITYEDPRYASDADLRDVTDLVRKDLDHYPPGKAPRVIGPKGGRLVATASSTTPRDVLGQLLKAQAASDHGGKFAVVDAGGFLHVVPNEVLDRDGNWTPQSSVLDVSISLVSQSRTARELIEAICHEVSKAAHSRVNAITDNVGTNMVEEGKERLRYSFSARNETARMVLARAFSEIEAEAGPVTWYLYYGNQLTDNSYALNVIPLRVREAKMPSTVPAKPKPPPATSPTENPQPKSRGVK